MCVFFLLFVCYGWDDRALLAVWRWLSSVTPLGYAFEALLINEFSDTNGERPYRIEGSVSLLDLLEKFGNTAHVLSFLLTFLLVVVVAVCPVARLCVARKGCIFLLRVAGEEKKKGCVLLPVFSRMYAARL